MATVEHPHITTNDLSPVAAGRSHTFNEEASSLQIHSKRIMVFLLTGDIRLDLTHGPNSNYVWCGTIFHPLALPHVCYFGGHGLYVEVSSVISVFSDRRKHQPPLHCLRHAAAAGVD